MNNVIIRQEKEVDFAKVEELTREAFWNLYFPGCDEHYLCHILREHEDFVPELDYVAEINNQIIGSIMYTHSSLIHNDEEVHTLSFGPLCIHPQHQRKGVGTLLIEKTKALAMDMGKPAITIYGDPHNYCKHGFKNGMDYQVSNMDGDYPLGLLVLELQKGFFGNKKWKAKQSDAFVFEQEKVEEFDKRFPEKEKGHQYSQDLFSMLIRSYLRPGS